MSETSNGTAAELLEEGDRLEAAIRKLDGQPGAGPELLRLYQQLEDVVARSKTLIGAAGS